MEWFDAAVTGMFLLVAGGVGALVVNSRHVSKVMVQAREEERQSPARILQEAVHQAVGTKETTTTAPDGWIDPLLYDHDETSKSPLVRKAPFARGTKRLTDIILAFMLIVFSAPLIISVAILIKLDSPGSIFYQQKRVGRDGKLFHILKFRTMRTDAENDGPKWAAKADSRITKIGSFLRKSRIDEIPQAVNILRGDMSFVGPRPERPEFTEELAAEIPNFEARTLVKPGLTGWAQVNLPYAASVNDTRMKLAYDLYYIEKQSPWLDMLIVLKTFRVALFSDSAH